MSNVTKFITIKEASRIIGVTPLTLRNWDKNGKLRPLRHPINNYRVYKREDIEKLLSDIGSNYNPIQKPKKLPKKLSVKHLDEYGDIRDGS